MERRTRNHLSLLLLLSICVRLGVAALIRRPGYMDVAYYTAGAIRLAEGHGFSEPFIWNYLNPPSGLPHPGFLYWAPLPSLLAAPFARLSPESFALLQIPFALLSALLPPIAYAVAWRTTSRRHIAWLAGLITLFSGFYIPFWSLPETFAPFAVCGSLSLWLSGQALSGSRKSIGWAVVNGLLIGIGHLARPEAPLFLVLGIGSAFFVARSQHQEDEHHSLLEREEAAITLRYVAALLIGYLLAMAPWLLRNVLAFGTPFPSTGTETVWLTNYDDLFCYDCDLSAQSYLAWGWRNILRSKLTALKVNGARFLAENCLVFLFPFALIGLYRLRHKAVYLLTSFTLATIYLVHSLLFTFPGPRGSFFHATASLLPFLFTAAGVGLSAVVRWAARKRRWNVRQALRVFTAQAVLGAVLLSGYALTTKIPAWQEVDVVYEEIGGWIEQESDGPTTVMVGDPPSFWLHTRIPAVVVPNEGLEATLEVARRYDVDYLILDPNRPAPLAPLYEGDRETGAPDIERRFGRTVVYRLPDR